MPERYIKNHIKKELYINLGIILIIVYVDENIEQKAFEQILKSRYGQALSRVYSLPKDSYAHPLIKWYLSFDNGYWKITTSADKSYVIDDLGLLGVHYENQKEEISDSFEQVLFEQFIGYHASMVSNRTGEVLMICGFSGSGKTTLTKSLVSIGGNYVSDDLALIDKDLTCQYFRTSFHIRTNQSLESHILNDEFRKFELVTDQPIINNTLNLKGIVFLKQFVEDETKIREITDKFQKFKLINSVIIDYPNIEYVFETTKLMLAIPFYEINMCKKDDIKSVANYIGGLVWGKNI